MFYIKHLCELVSVFYFIVSFHPVLLNFIIFSVWSDRAKLFCMRFCKINMQIHLTKEEGKQQRLTTWLQSLTSFRNCGYWLFCNIYKCVLIFFFNIHNTPSHSSLISVLHVSPILMTTHHEMSVVALFSALPLSLHWPHFCSWEN